MGFIRRGQSVEFSVKQQREPKVRPPSCHGSDRQPGSRDGRAPPASSPPVPSVMAVLGSHEDGVNTATADAAPWFGAESFMLSCSRCHRRKTQTFRRLLLRSQRWRTAASICRLCLKRSGTSWQSWIWSCPKVSFGGVNGLEPRCWWMPAYLSVFRACLRQIARRLSAVLQWTRARMRENIKYYGHFSALSIAWSPRTLVHWVFIDCHKSYECSLWFIYLSICSVGVSFLCHPSLITKAIKTCTHL